ncbi:hypothetical protein L3X38_018580 [Prunus dulcis]|uniref:Uncharacterized protein n=1 Tax=Prunus dulcis TaxID=3755 RepID=A0AAD4ZBS0_PRUDU|nr:hypothetical protein L3X38_018580 [Prunus dulcis]
MCGGQSRVEKMWRVENGEEERASGIFLGLLTVVGAGFPVGMSLRFLLDPSCPTCINTGLLFTLSHTANLTSLLSSLKKILENFLLLVEESSCRASQNDWSGGGHWWLLSDDQEEIGGLPTAEDVERWKQDGSNPDDLPAAQEECSVEPPQRGRLMSRYCPLWAGPTLPSRICSWELTEQLPRVVTHPGIALASNSLNFGVPTNPKPVSSQEASHYFDARFDFSEQWFLFFPYLIKYKEKETRFVLSVKMVSQQQTKDSGSKKLGIVAPQDKSSKEMKSSKKMKFASSSAETKPDNNL